MKLPEVRRWRLVPGQRLPRGSAPLGVTSSAALDGSLLEGDALWLSPTGVDEVPALAAMLPDPATFRGLVVIGPSAAETGFLSRILGRERHVPRAVRGAALLLRGYRAIAGGVDPKSELDLCWAWAG